MTQKLTVKQLRALLDNDLVNVALKHDVGAGVPVSNSLHGTGGIFSEPGARAGVYSAIVQPRTWMEGLPLIKSETENEAIEILTALSATVGTNPADYCGDPVTPGDLYKCKINRVYGKMFVGGKKVIVPNIGKLRDHADMERQILNATMQGDPLLPDILRNTTKINTRSESARQLFEVGTAARRAIAPVTIDGNSALGNANTEKGWIKEFDGLSRMVKTGYLNVDSTACPAADSLVIPWAAAADATVGGAGIAVTITEMYYSRQQLALDTGFDGVAWEFVGDKRLFRQLTFLFACTYAQSRCTTGGAGDPIGRTAEAIEARTNEMVRGQYLLIDGQPIPFRFTAGTEVSQAGAVLTTDLFLVPLSWVGGDLTYLQYFPMDNEYINEWNALGNTTARQVLNNGLYMLWMKSTGGCDQLQAASQMRLMLDTPFLAARLDDISFASYVGYRDYNPANTMYFYGGGVSTYGA